MVALKFEFDFRGSGSGVFSHLMKQGKQVRIINRYLENYF